MIYVFSLQYTLTRSVTANTMFSAFQSLHYAPIHSEFTTVNSPLNPLCYFLILSNLHFILYTNLSTFFSSVILVS